MDTLSPACVSPVREQDHRKNKEMQKIKCFFFRGWSLLASTHLGHRADIFDFPT